MVSPTERIQITTSVGGSFAPIWIRSTPALWVERADALLYQAKMEGRDRVFIDVQPEISVSAEEKNMLFGHLTAGDPAWIESMGSDGSKSSAASTTNRVN